MKSDPNPIIGYYMTKNDKKEAAKGQPMNPKNLPNTREHDTIKSRTNGQDYEIGFGPQSGGNVPKNPFASKAQQGYMYAHPEILGKKGLKEWSGATDFSKLPKKKGKK